MRRGLTVFIVLASLQIPVVAWSTDNAVVLSIATAPHPHVRALMDGRVSVDGCQITFSTQPLSALMGGFAAGSKYDVVEVDLLPYLQKKAAGEWKGYTLIPVFLSREFQLRNIVIRKDKGILNAGDLRGKVVGVSGSAGTATTWLRGVLQSSWSITTADIHWMDTEQAVSSMTSLAAGLASGKLDAAFNDGTLDDVIKKNPDVKRLFENYKKAEYDTFEETRIFPILTALAVRESLVDENPWLPEALFIAFSQAKEKAMADLTLPLPWGGEKLDETEKLLGKNFWSYGVKSNPKTLGALFRYAEEQKLLTHPLNMEEIFTPSTLSLLEN